MCGVSVFRVLLYSKNILMNSSLGMCVGKETETTIHTNRVGRIIILECICGIIITVTFQNFVHTKYHVGNKKSDTTTIY